MPFMTGNSAQAAHMYSTPSMGRDTRAGALTSPMSAEEALERAQQQRAGRGDHDQRGGDRREPADLLAAAVGNDQPVRHHRGKSDRRERDRHAERDGDDADDTRPHDAKRDREQDHDQGAGTGRDAGRREQQPTGERTLPGIVMVMAVIMVIMIMVMSVV